MQFQDFSRIERESIFVNVFQIVAGDGTVKIDISVRDLETILKRDMFGESLIQNVCTESGMRKCFYRDVVDCGSVNVV